MKRFLALLVGLSFVLPCLCEAGAHIGRSGVGSVEGFVYDGLTSSRLMAVMVEAPGMGPRYTDRSGFFKIKDLPVGINRLVFRLNGFVPQEEIFVVYEDERVYLSVFMWPIAACPVVERPVVGYPLYCPPPSCCCPPSLFVDPGYYRLSRPALDWWYRDRYYYYRYCPCHPYAIRY